MKLPLILLLAVWLTGCASFGGTTVTRIPCILPDDLKQKEAMADHPEKQTPALTDGGAAWAKDRAQGAKGWKKHGDTVDFVQRNCQ